MSMNPQNQEVAAATPHGGAQSTRLESGEHTLPQPTLPWSDGEAAQAPAGLPQPAGGPVTFGGRYELFGDVRAGGMGLVYKAKDTALDRVVALKMMRAGANAPPEEVWRFQREARAVGRLKHPHIVPVHDVGRQDGIHFLTMEYVEGGNLAQLRPRFQDDPRATAVLMEKVARAVQYAHERNILHRDLKPANILVDEAGEPHVTDFGLAKFLDPDTRPAPTQTAADGKAAAPLDPGSASPTDVAIRTLGTVGTPAYMSPEAAAGGAAIPACDVWGLGVILYELLTGERPFKGKEWTEIIEQIRTCAPVRPRERRPGVDSALEVICLRCLEKEPAQRYPSAAALADDLARWQRGELVAPAAWPKRIWRRARRRPLVVMMGVVLLSLAAAVCAPVLFSSPDPDRPLDAIYSELEKEGRVTLVPAQGPPRWFQWQQDGGNLDESRPDGTFSFTTTRLGLVELLPTVPLSAFRLRAEVRHYFGGDHHAFIGLYIAHGSYPNADGPEHHFTTLTFDDKAAPVLPGALYSPAWGAAATASMEVLPPPGKVPRGEPRYSEVLPAFWRVYDPSLTCSSQTWLRHRFIPASVPAPGGLRGGQDRWRELAIEVTPEQVRFFWEGDGIGQLSRAEADVMIARLQRKGSPLNPQPLLNAQGGVGLLVNSGGASFRDVILERLDDN